jgi:hypothetical protein
VIRPLLAQVRRLIFEFDVQHQGHDPAIASVVSTPPPGHAPAMPLAVEHD